jgi:predicted ATPase
MLINALRVSNFRSIRDAGLDCDLLTVLIGRNGAGKSNFVKALDVFYDLVAPVSAEDFFGRDISAPIEIRVTYGNLSLAEEKEFATYTREGSLTVTKRITAEDGRIVQKYYAAAQQIPQFASIRGLANKTDRRTAWRELVADGTLPELSGSARNADEVEQFLAAYEREHPELLDVVEREEQFFGPRNIGGGKLDKYTKFVLVPAVREASDEVGGRKGAIQQILETLVLRKLSAREDVQAFRKDFEDRARDLFGPATDSELKGVAASLTDSLAAFAPGSSLRLCWDEVAVPEVQPPAAKVTLVEDDFEGDIERKGHGLQRALVLTLLRELAMLAPSVPEEDDGSGVEEDEAARGAGAGAHVPDLILAIEEPELYLHPSRCRYLSRLLLELSSRKVTSRNQIIYTTHSPHFVDLRRFDQIRRVNKVAQGGRDVRQTTTSRFSLREAAERLADVCGKPPGAFTPESFASRAVPVMNQTVNEGFFADVVVLMEGSSDVAALWKLQEVSNAGWDERGIAVVPADGKESMDRPAVVFRGLSIETYLIFDADRRHRGSKSEEHTCSINRRCLRLVGAAVEDFPDTQVHDRWAVLEDNLEALLARELGDDNLDRLIGEVADEVGCERGRKALKRMDVVPRVVESAYNRGLRLPTLEKIVESVTRLAPVQTRT